MLILRRTGFLLLIATLAALALLPPPAGIETNAPLQVKILFAGLAAFGFVLSLITIRLVFRRVDHLIERGYILVHQTLSFQRFEVVSAAQLKEGMILVARVCRIGIILLLWSIFVARILRLYPEAQPLAQEIQLAVLEPVETMGQAVIEYVPNLIRITVILLITHYTLKVIHVLFHAVDAGIIVIPDFYPDWAEPTYKIVRMMVYVFVSIMIVPLLPGANSQLFEKVSFFIGLLVSLGSTSAIKNMTAGIVLTYTRSFQIGDRIRIGEVSGDVVEKSLFVTRLQTIKNEQVAIPNGVVLDSNIVNYTTLAMSNGLILHTSVTIGYDVDWRQVQDLLITAAYGTPHIADEPPPFVLQTSLDDYYVSYEINAYTDAPQRMAVTLSTLHENILDSFHRAGVEIMSPAYSALRNGSDIAIPRDSAVEPVPPQAIPAGRVPMPTTALRRVRVPSHR